MRQVSGRGWYGASSWTAERGRQAGQERDGGWRMTVSGGIGWGMKAWYGKSWDFGIVLSSGMPLGLKNDSLKMRRKQS